MADPWISLANVSRSVINSLHNNKITKLWKQGGCIFGLSFLMIYDAMFQCLLQNKMKTNMSHTGGKLKKNQLDQTY